MGRILISEDEKKRILGMHVDKGYTSIVSEQGVKPTPPAPVKKTVTVADANNSYLQFDPVGQILAKNPAFVKFINDNKINLKASKLQLVANNSQATMVGKDGKPILVNFMYFDGNIPSDVDTQYATAYKTVNTKINELASNPQIKQNNCFDVSLLRANKDGNATFCKSYWNEFNTLVKSTNYEGLNSLRQMKNFLDNAPKFTV